MRVLWRSGQEWDPSDDEPVGSGACTRRLGERVKVLDERVDGELTDRPLPCIMLLGPESARQSFEEKRT
jgi:hypothetical protein